MSAESCCTPIPNGDGGLMHAAGCPGVPLFCPLCERDCGPVWPRVPNGPLPAIVHRPDGTHTCDWASGEEGPQPVDLLRDEPHVEVAAAPEVSREDIR